MKKILRLISYVCFAVALILVVIGKIKGFHLTEGESFVYLWHYWLSAIVLGAIGGLLWFGGE